MISPSSNPPPVGATGARLRYFFATPWWRLPLWIVSVVWLAVLNVIYIDQGARLAWLGLVSVLPVSALAADVLVRAMRSDRK